MFFEQLQKLYKQNNTTITALLKSMGISTANGTYWKQGSVPSSDTVAKIAEHFGVSTDYLLGTEAKVTERDIQVALFDDAEDSEEMWEQVKNFAKFLRENKK